MTDTESPSTANPPTVAGVADPEEVDALATEVLDALSETMPELLSGPSSIAPGTWLAGRVAILGGSPAEFTILVEAELGARLAVAYGLVDGDVPELEDAVDAFGEFVNVMGGSLKTAFDYETSLGIPSVETIDGGVDETDGFISVYHPVGQLLISIAAS